MAALGLRGWLSRLKRRSARPAVVAEEQRLKRWRCRPVLEQLEERQVIGSLLVRPIVPDGYWLDDGLDRVMPAGSGDTPAKASSPSAITPPEISVSGQPAAPAASAPGNSAPQQSEPGTSSPVTPFTTDAGADLGHTPLDVNLFAALESPFADARSAKGGGGGAAVDGSGAGGGAAAGGGGSAGGMPGTGSGGASVGMIGGSAGADYGGTLASATFGTEPAGFGLPSNGISSALLASRATDRRLPRQIPRRTLRRFGQQHRRNDYTRIAGTPDRGRASLRSSAGERKFAARPLWLQNLGRHPGRQRHRTHGLTPG